MTGREHITLVDLLHRREEEFIRIWQCEQKLREIIPGFPIPAPPALPSCSRAPKKPQEKSKPSAAAKLRIRVLDSRRGENAYRFLFLYKGEEQSSFQLDTKCLDTLLAVNSTDFSLLRIETVEFSSLQEFKTIDVVWQP